MTGPELKKIRKLAGLSQKAFAKQIKVRGTQIRDWEQGLLKSGHIPELAEDAIRRTFPDLAGIVKDPEAPYPDRILSISERRAVKDAEWLLARGDPETKRALKKLIETMKRQLEERGAK